MPLTLEVNKSNGSVKIKGNPSLAANVDYYQINSVAGALDQVHWNSLDQQNLFAVDGSDAGSVAGDSPTEGWDKSPTATNGQLTEYFLPLGRRGRHERRRAFRSVMRLQHFRVWRRRRGSAIHLWDRRWSAAYWRSHLRHEPRAWSATTTETAWSTPRTTQFVRDHLGQTFPLVNRDPVNPGAISVADYNSWKSHFGMSGKRRHSSTVGAVPEPRAALLLLLGTLLTLKCGAVGKETCLGPSEERHDDQRECVRNLDSRWSNCSS